MTNLTCIPIQIFPKQSLAFKRSEVIPGVTIVSAERLRRSLFSSIDERMRREPGRHLSNLHRSHFLLIDDDRYLLGLRTRLANEGEALPARPSNGEPWIDVHAIVRQILISAALVGQVQFLSNTVFHFMQKHNEQRLQSHGPLRPGARTYQIRPGFRPTPIGHAPLRRTALVLDRYYRTGTWWEDRLGSALAHFWDAMCTPHHDHAFIGLTMTLEAALSTSQSEVTHQLAERVAVILNPHPGPERRGDYDMIKDLYGIRSKLVHGRAGPRKGKILSNTLAVMARRINIPLDKYELLLQVVINVLRSLVRDKEYLAILHKTRSDQKTDQKINVLMQTRLLG